MQIAGHSSIAIHPAFQGAGRPRINPSAQAGEADETQTKNQAQATDQAGASATQQALTQEELRQVQQLKQRDREVRAHEAAHQAAAGGLAKGGASFSYDRGPDGRLYAVGGEVGIDTGKVAGDPEATLRKAQQVQAAALAPAQPSAQDRAVAAQAAVMAAEARSELAARRAEERQGPEQEAKASPQDDQAGSASDTQAPQRQHSQQVSQYQQTAGAGHGEERRSGISLMA